MTARSRSATNIDSERDGDEAGRDGGRAAQVDDGLHTDLRKLLHRLLPGLATDVDADADLFRAGLDSLKAVEFVLAIEERYRVEFRFADITYERFKTIRSVADLVRANSSPSSSDPAPW
jgi:acyl carrier protein